ncbi:hypothetical protein C0J52_28104 [Blattella germanica]|nr:hypothetical protein C0J52_28104 [Blattella germanica]
MMHEAGKIVHAWLTEGLQEEIHNFWLYSDKTLIVVTLNSAMAVDKVMQAFNIMPILAYDTFTVPLSGHLGHLSGNFFNCSKTSSSEWFLQFEKQIKVFSSSSHGVTILQWRIQANIRLRNVSSLVCGFMKKNEVAKRTKKSEKTSFFVSIKQLSVKPISETGKEDFLNKLCIGEFYGGVFTCMMITFLGYAFPPIGSLLISSAKVPMIQSVYYRHHRRNIFRSSAAFCIQYRVC